MSKQDNCFTTYLLFLGSVYSFIKNMLLRVWIKIIFSTLTSHIDISVLGSHCSNNVRNKNRVPLSQARRKIKMRLNGTIER